MTFTNILTAVGVASTVSGFIYVGRKLQILDDLKITSDKMNVNLTVISNFLIRNNKHFNSSELHSLSPLTLTPEGSDFINRVGFTDVFRDHSEDFFHCIDTDGPRLKYDVEIASIKSISALYDKEYMNFLKVFFYNHPDRNLENTAPTLGVYIRDKYLQKHPEIIQ